ncbi:MAG: hypothetical protein IJ874_04915 [Ruminococcus sp.]|nr:hypothetical protein [Ruminococcus sp.]
MRSCKWAAVLVSLIMVVSAAGCEDKNEATGQQIRDYLEELYGREFTQVKKITVSYDNTGADELCYVFADNDGTECHVYYSVERGSYGWHYNISEDYQAAYITDHQEILSGIAGLGSEYSVSATENDLDLNSFVLDIYFEGYDNIEEIVREAVSAAAGIPQINPNETFSLSGMPSVSRRRAEVGFIQSGTGAAESTVRFEIYLDRSEGVSLGKQDEMIASLQSSYSHGIAYESEVQPETVQDTPEENAAENVPEQEQAAEEYQEYEPEYPESDDSCYEPDYPDDSWYEDYNEPYYEEYYDEYYEPEYGWNNYQWEE